MNIYENNKQLLTTMGGDSANLSTDFEVRKAILNLLGGDSSTCNSIYEVDKQILNIYLEGGGTGGDCDLTPITITENGVYSREIGGYNEVTVNVEIPECPEIPLTAITINSNGTYIPEEGGYSEVVVDVAGGGTGGGKTLVRSFSIDANCIVDGTWDASVLDISNVTSFREKFSSLNTLKELDLSGWNTGNVTDMYRTFYQCNALQSLGDLSNWDTGNVTTMKQMFFNCNALQSLDLSGWNTGNVTNIENIFTWCKSLQSVGDLSNWDTSKVTSMTGMFISCYQLQSLGDLSGWDTSNVKDMSSMFSGCELIQSLGDLSGWDTSNVKDMISMFSGCDLLQTLDLSGWDTSNVKSTYQMFYSCEALQSLIGGRTIDEVISNNISALNGLKVNTDLDNTILDRASLRAIINGLADLTGSTSQRLYLSSTLKSKLTEEDIAVATAKNWTITSY